MVLKFVSLTDTVVATWAENEKIAILYEVSETKYVAEANVDAVDGESGTRYYSVRLIQNK